MLRFIENYIIVKLYKGSAWWQRLAGALGGKPSSFSLCYIFLKYHVQAQASSTPATLS